MIEAGSETTSQALNNCIIGLLSNPEAVRLGQEELDRVIGNDRPPNYDDETNLPYIRAIIKVHSQANGLCPCSPDIHPWQ
jgi:cytochrome P450